MIREYTDATFAVAKERTSEYTHLGILGPLLRAQVGDTIRVHFRNNASITMNLVARALRPDITTEIGPGAVITYNWYVPESAGPGEHEVSTTFYPYYSTYNQVAVTNAGIIGGITITKYIN